MRVLINDRPLRQTLTGVGNYIAQLLLHLPAAGVAQTPFFFTYLSREGWTPPTDGEAPSQPRDLGGSRKPWWLRSIMQSVYGAAFAMAARRYDLYHEPNHIPMRTGCPTVTTIHDLSVIEHPEWHPADRVRWYERDFLRGVERTRRFIAASEFTRRQMMSRLGIAAERIDVTYQAARPAFCPRAPEACEPVLQRLGLRPGFFLYVGTLEPRKNVDCLVQAFAALPADIRRRHPLVIAGAWGWKAEALRERLGSESLGETVKLAGYMSDEPLAALYSACACLVWPTLYEGFGLPPLEAMACGAAVLVSGVSSLPEVVGSAGVVLDPHSPEAWTSGMRRVVEDEDWRVSLREAGLRQAARFSWSECARQTVECYRKALT